MAEFMFQNVAYRATVYRTGLLLKKSKVPAKGLDPASSQTMLRIQSPDSRIKEKCYLTMPVERKKKISEK